MSDQPEASKPDEKNQTAPLAKTPESEDSTSARQPRSRTARVGLFSGVLFLLVGLFVFLVPVRDNPQAIGFRQTVWDMVYGNVGSAYVIDSAHLAYLLRFKDEEKKRLERQEQNERQPWKAFEGRSVYIFLSGQGTTFGRLHVDRECAEFKKDVEYVKANSSQPETDEWRVVNGELVWAFYVERAEKKENWYKKPSTEWKRCPLCTDPAAEADRQARLEKEREEKIAKQKEAREEALCEAFRANLPNEFKKLDGDLHCNTLTITQDFGKRGYVLRGKLANCSAKDLSWIRLKFTLFDENGALVATDDAFVQHASRRSITEFEVFAQGVQQDTKKHKYQLELVKD